MGESEESLSPGFMVISFRESGGFYAVVVLVFIISVIATIYFCVSMSGGMEMPGGWTMSMIWMRMPGHSWAESAGMFLVMWIAMMIAMMLPSVLPRLAGYRHSFFSEDAGSGDLSTLMAAAGYFTVWAIFGICVYPVGIYLALAAMQWPLLSRAIPLLSGSGIILAGAFQFTGWKMKGLGQCRCDAAIECEKGIGPLRRGWGYGLREGKNCLICCSGFMLVLLILGAMDMLVMVIVAGVITAEKFLKNPGKLTDLTGLVTILAGVVMVVRSLLLMM